MLHSESSSNVFCPHYNGGISKRNIHRSVWICFRKTQSGISHDYRDVIVFERLRSQNVFSSHRNAKLAFSNSSSLKSVFEKLRFRDGSVQTVDLAVEIKLILSEMQILNGR